MSYHLCCERDGSWFLWKWLKESVRKRVGPSESVALGMETHISLEHKIQGLRTLHAEASEDPSTTCTTQVDFVFMTLLQESFIF